MKGFVRVKFLKPAPKYAYREGAVGLVLEAHAPDLLKNGYITILPEEEEQKKRKEKINTLPEDLPGRAVLFDGGFESLEDLRKAGDSLIDTGISKQTLKRIKKYLENAED